MSDLNARESNYIWTVHVKGEYKGQVYKFKGLWRWQKTDGSLETLERDMILHDAQKHIAEVLNVRWNVVGLQNTHKKWPGARAHG